MERERIVEALFKAVENGRLEETEDLLKSYGLSDIPTMPEGCNLIEKALHKAHTEIAGLLLKYGCRVNYEGAQGNQITRLHVAVITNQIDIIKKLLDEQVEIEALDKYHRTPLLTAIGADISIFKYLVPEIESRKRMKLLKSHAKKRFAIVELLVKHGADVNARDKYGNVPLYFAITERQIEVVELLLKNKADTKYLCREQSDTLLHLTVSWNIATPKANIAMTKLLLDHGVDPNVRNAKGETPLHSAVYTDNLWIVRMLIDKNADINARDQDNRNALHHAVKNMVLGYNNLRVSTAVVNTLLDSGADPNVYDIEGETPLHWYMRMPYIKSKSLPLNFDRHRRIIDNLLSHGADINGVSVKYGVRGPTPLQTATKEMCDAECIEYLLSRGADPNPETDYESTPLYLAVKNGDSATVRVLLNHGAKLDPEDSDGKSILQVAVDSGCPGVVEQILESVPSNTREVSMTLLESGEGSFFDRLKSWFKDRAGRTTGFTENECRKILNTFLQDAYTNETEANTDRDSFSDLSGVEHIIKYYSEEDVSKTENEGNTSKEGEIVKLLLSNEVQIDFRGQDYAGLLCYAIKYGDVEITKLCLKSQSKVDPHAFIVAAAVGRKEIVDILLNHDPSIDINADVYGITPLLCTAINKAEFPFINEPDLIIDDDAKDDIARLLISRGVNVLNDQEMEPPLCIAARNNRHKLVALIMDQNAGFAEGYERSNAAFHEAIAYRRLNVVDILLKYGVDIDNTNYSGETGLDVACREGRAEIVKFLLEQGASKGEYFEKYVLGSLQGSVEVQLVIQRHIVRMMDSKECLDGSNLRQYENIRSNRKLSDFVKNCKEEADRMRSEKIGNSNISFYNIVEKNIDQLTMYVRNESIRRALESRNLEKEFPIHFKVMKFNLWTGGRRALLLDLGAELFDAVFGSMPKLVIDCVFAYLNSEDLIYFIKAAEILDDKKA